MNAPPLSEVKSRIKKLNELIQRLEAAEDNTKALSNEKVRSTVTNCLEVALKTLREDRSKIEDQVAQPMSS
jgi:hypothetical protein